MSNAINWFEIPVANYDRARKFYSHVYGTELAEWEAQGLKMAFIPMSGTEGVGGAIVQGEGYVPSDKGTMVYLNAGNDLSPMLARVEGAGGKILTPKALVNDEIGYMAIILDSEGNKVAFHSRA